MRHRHQRKLPGTATPYAYRHRASRRLYLSTLQASGFAVTYRLFNLSDYGVAQTRRRVIILGTRGMKRISFDRMPKANARTLKEALGNLPDSSNATGLRRLTDRDRQIAPHIGPGQRLTNVRQGPLSVHTWSIPEVFGKVNRHERRVLAAISRIRRRRRRREIGDADPIRAEQIAEYLHIDEDAHSTLSTLADRGYVRRVDDRFDLTHTFNGKYKRLQWDRCAPTVDTRFVEPRYFLHPEECRGFSIREMAALQDFPDSFSFPTCVTTSSRLIGNAVPPRFSEAMAIELRRGGWPS